MGTYIALLKGINVGGNRKVPMADLRQVVADAGFGDVRTYIQSGNVVCTSSRRSSAAVAAELERVIGAAFGFDVPVVVRRDTELAAVVAGNPFLTPTPRADEQFLHVMFLSAPPTAEHAAGLDPARSPADEFVLVGQELYLHCPQGVAGSRLTNDHLERVLHVRATGRNWRTVTTLLDLATG